jgi:hypothetical protein
MRRAAWWASVLLLAASSATAGEREWVLQAGAGLSGAEDYVLVGGRSLSLGLATPVRSWLVVEAKAAWHEFPAGTGTTDWNGVFQFDRSRVIAATLNSRFQIPVRSGLSPYAVLEAGAGGASLSEVRWIYELPRVSPGKSGLVWITGAGLGMRLVLPRAWPDFDASIRGGYWTSPSIVFRDGYGDEGHRASYAELRLACAF